ncbi:hypothetical protein [Rhodococcus sp. 11-3]|uniref:hypothetical protein n=1 Tax=Rhodococcus sp. 11-3 TaxID=2854796 RepID=UPI00203A55F7|nr:hypothetical protein [Rhodococcus sp. 11-3]USC17011.1 hypothetical protein KZJ41_09155 [Rhodococcus sp. 11-3]
MSFVAYYPCCECGRMYAPHVEGYTVLGVRPSDVTLNQDGTFEMQVDITRMACTRCRP